MYVILSQNVHFPPQDDQKSAWLTVIAFLKKQYAEGMNFMKPQFLLHKPAVQCKPGLSVHLPPQIQQFSRVVFMLHESNEITKEDADSVATMLYGGNITIDKEGECSVPLQRNVSYYQRCKKYTDITDILNMLRSHKPFLLVLEGGPGMGKTTVCNEIAKRWGNGTNDNYELVFLLCLHIPSVKNIDSFDSLFEAVCPGDQKNFLQHILHHLNHTRGKNILIIFDGFDELFDEQGTPSSSYLLNIVYRKLLQLQLCAIVISSRHPASLQLYQRSDCTRVEILGFSDELKLNFIQQNNAG